MKKPRNQAARIGIAEAKAELSRVVREVEAGPTIIQNRGRDVAVLLSMDEYKRILERGDDRSSPMQDLLHDIEELKRTLGGGVDFEPARMDYVPRDPFACTDR